MSIINQREKKIFPDDELVYISEYIIDKGLIDPSGNNVIREYNLFIPSFYDFKNVKINVYRLEDEDGVSYITDINATDKDGKEFTVQIPASRIYTIDDYYSIIHKAYNSKTLKKNIELDPVVYYDYESSNNKTESSYIVPVTLANGITTEFNVPDKNDKVSVNGNIVSILDENGNVKETFVMFDHSYSYFFEDGIRYITPHSNIELYNLDKLHSILGNVPRNAITGNKLIIKEREKKDQTIDLKYDAFGILNESSDKCYRYEEFYCGEVEDEDTDDGVESIPELEDIVSLHKHYYDNNWLSLDTKHLYCIDYFSVVDDPRYFKYTTQVLRSKDHKLEEIAEELHTIEEPILFYPKFENVVDEYLSKEKEEK